MLHLNNTLTSKNSLTFYQGKYPNYSPAPILYMKYQFIEHFFECVATRKILFSSVKPSTLKQVRVGNVQKLPSINDAALEKASKKAKPPYFIKHAPKLQCFLDVKLIPVINF